MRNTRWVVSVFAALVLGAAAFGQEGSPEKQVLKEIAVSVGDVYVISVRNNLEMQVRGVPEGSTEAVVDAPYVLNVQEKYTQSILAISGEKPTYFTRKYNISKVTRTKSAGEEPTTSVLPRHGKTLTVRVKGKAVTITSGKDKLPAPEIAALKRIFLSEGTVNPYPAHPVGPGDEWTKEGSEVVKDPSGGVRRLQAKYLDVVQYEGHPCARISLTMEMNTEQGGIPIQTTMTGEVMHALDIHRDLSVNLSGDINAKSKITRNGITVDMSTQGISSFTQTEVWLKSKGKPVPKPKPAAPAPAPSAAPN